MLEVNETNPEASNEELSNLKGALQQALDDGDMQRAGEIRIEIMPHLRALQEEIKVTPEEAKEIMGEEFFGPEEVELALGQPIDRRDIPTIPFPEEDLKRAKEMGQFLILRVNKTARGESLRGWKIYEELKGAYLNEEGKRNLRNTQIHPLSLETVSEETPEKGWALVSKEVLVTSKNNCYDVQTSALLSELIAAKSSGLSDIEKKAMGELFEKSDLILKLQESAKGEDVVQAIDILESLEGNKMLRPSITEVFYDMFVCYKTRGERLYQGQEIWTKSRNSDKQGFLSIDNSRNSLSILCPYPAYKDNYLGTVFSRRS
ncbi:MAG: hypothetical protein Q7S53_05210 [bacterium]|nr:hypothetical protein [bacterium]